MGYMRDHAIVVSGYHDDGALNTARQKAVDLFGEGRVSDVLGPFVNGCRSFFIAPDGSKEGWEQSNDSDNARADFKNYLREQKANNGFEWFLNWAEVQFGDDEYQTIVVDHSDAGLSDR